MIVAMDLLRYSTPQDQQRLGRAIYGVPDRAHYPLELEFTTFATPQRPAQYEVANESESKSTNTEQEVQRVKKVLSHLKSNVQKKKHLYNI